MCVCLCVYYTILSCSMGAWGPVCVRVQVAARVYACVCKLLGARVANVSLMCC